MKATIALSFCAGVLCAASDAGKGDWMAQLEEANRLLLGGRYGEAESMLRSAIARGPAGDPAGFGTALNNLASLYHDVGRCEEGKIAYQRALSVFQKAHQTEAALRTGVNLAALLFDCGAPDKAAALARRLVEPHVAELMPEERARALVLQGNLHLEKKRYAQAETVLCEAMNIFDSQGERAAMQGALAMNSLALVHARMGRSAEAIEEILQARSLLEAALAPAHPVIAKLLNNLGAIYFGMGRNAEAEEALRQALEISTKSLGGDHPLAAAILLQYAAVLRAGNRKAEAVVARNRAREIMANALRPATVDVSELRDNR